MRSQTRLIDRFVAPLLMASGVTLIGAGLLTLGSSGVGALPTQPPVAGLASSTPRTSDAILPTARPIPSPTATPAPDATVPPSSPSPSASAVPSVTPSSEPSATPSLVPLAFATRVVFTAEDIDLPIISRLKRVPGQGPDRYPPCDVALYHDAFVQPSQEGTTYLFAHAQEGMFLPLLEESRRNNGQRMLGRLIEIYTDDDRRYVYEITRVRRHALDFSITQTGPGVRQAILQTSEGPFGTFDKLQILGVLIAEGEAERSEAHPDPRPRPCFPG